MSSRRHTQVSLFCISLVGIFLLLSAPVEGQPARDAMREEAAGRTAADIARWRYLLDELVIKSRELSREEDRSVVTAEIADAYWDVDQLRARELFTSALEAALSLKPGTKEVAEALRQVIGLAAKRDASLVKRLTKKVLESDSGKSWAATGSMSVALDMLEADPQGAAQLAESYAPAGPTLSTAWFILQLARRDPAAAERVYRVYLGQFTAGRQLGLDCLLWLVGYPFGYAEAFGGGPDPARMPGFSGLRSAGLGPRPALAQAFLDVAFLQVQDTLRQASAAPAERAEALRGLALFATTYLLPEVQRYRPAALQQWALLQQQAMSGAPAAQREGVARRIQGIVEGRVRASGPEEAETYKGEQAEDLLARARDLPSGCKRDMEYARAALRVGHSQDFTRAIEVTGRVENESLRDGVRQFLYYDLSLAEFDGKEPGSLDIAQKYAERIDSPEQRALLYVKMSKAALRRQDRQSAAALLGKATLLAERVPDSSSQAGILLAAVAVSAEFDTYDGYKALKEAVKVVNRARVEDVNNFRILRRVNLTCEVGKEAWYGDADRAERFSLFETFAAVAGADVDGALLLARDLDNVTISVRSMIAIAKAMIKRAGGVHVPANTALQASP